MLELPQDVGQALLDAAEVAVRRLRAFDTLEQIGDALLDMGHRSGVAADRQAVEAFGQRADRAFEVAGIGCRRHRAAFHRRRQQRDALFQRREHVAAAALRQMIDLLAQRADVIAHVRDRIVGGDVGGDVAQRADRVLELLDDVGIGVGANQQIDLAGQVLDRRVVALELLGRRQRPHGAVDFVQRALDAAERFLIADGVTAALDLLAQRTDLGLERIDRLARQGFRQRAADFGQFLAEGGNRLVEMVRAAQRLHLAGQVVELPLDAGQIDGRRRSAHRARQGPAAAPTA